MSKRKANNSSSPALVKRISGYSSAWPQGFNDHHNVTVDISDQVPQGAASVTLHVKLHGNTAVINMSRRPGL